MRFRQKMAKGKSKRSFRKGFKVKKKNTQARPMRGGFRL